MNLFIYQTYYEESQKEKLDVNFIPFNNIKNKNPELREYPLWKSLYLKHRNTDAYWGLLSWRWFEKTHLDSKEFKSWILNNPGYDVYHIDPFLDIALNYKNIFIQGERWRPGILSCCNLLFPKLGINMKAEDIEYKPDDFATCNYFIGNSIFWENYILFLDKVIEISKEDLEIKKCMFEDKQPYNGIAIPNFCFIVERLFSLYCYIDKSLKVKKFPASYSNYKSMYGEHHVTLVKEYERKNIK